MYRFLFEHPVNTVSWIFQYLACGTSKCGRNNPTKSRFRVRVVAKPATMDCYSATAPILFRDCAYQVLNLCSPFEEEAG